MSRRDDWARAAIDDKHFAWIAGDELAGMFVWFNILDIQRSKDKHRSRDDGEYQCDPNEWTSPDKLNIVLPDTPEERLLAIQNIFDTSPISLDIKINVITLLRKEWSVTGAKLKKRFRFLFKDRVIIADAIKDVIEYALDEGFPSFNLNCINPGSLRLAIPCMYHFCERRDRLHILRKMSRIYSVRKYQEKNKEKQLVTLLLDPDVKDMLDEIAEIKGISLHKLITHGIRRHYGTLRKPVQ